MTKDQLRNIIRETVEEFIGDGDADLTEVRADGKELFYYTDSSGKMKQILIPSKVRTGQVPAKTIRNDIPSDAYKELLWNLKMDKKERMNESSDYQEFVKKVMDRFGVDRIEAMSDEKKKRFFDYLDKNWNAGENETDIDEYASSEDDDVEVKASHGELVKIKSTGQVARVDNVYPKQPSNRTQYHVVILTAGNGKNDYDLKRKYLLQGHEFDTELRKGQFKKELSKLNEFTSIPFSKLTPAMKDVATSISKILKMDRVTAYETMAGELTFAIPVDGYTYHVPKSMLNAIKKLPGFKAFDFNKTSRWINIRFDRSTLDETPLNENQRLLDKIGDKLAELELKGKENTPEYKALEKKWKELDKKFGEGVVSEANAETMKAYRAWMKAANATDNRRVTHYTDEKKKQDRISKLKDKYEKLLRAEKDAERASKSTNEGMSLDQIKKAVDSGKRVHWSNKGYTVTKDKNGQYLIVHSGGNTIGLTHRDGKTLNGDPKEFFLAEYYRPYTSRSGDPKWINAKYAGTADDGTPFKKGEKVLYWPGGRRQKASIMVGKQADKEWREFQSNAADEEWMAGQFGSGMYREGVSFKQLSTNPSNSTTHGGTQHFSTIDGKNYVWNYVEVKNGKYVVVNKPTDTIAVSTMAGKKLNVAKILKKSVNEGVTTSELSSIKPREIVSLASNKTKNKQISLWLNSDARGKFESIVRDGIEILKRGSEDSLKSYTLQSVKDELADYVLYYALEAAIRDAQKELPSKKPSLKEETIKATAGDLLDGAKNKISPVDRAKLQKIRKDSIQIKVEPRDTSGMRGSQDKFIINVYHNGKKVMDLGSHPSERGAGNMVANWLGYANESLTEATKAGFGNNDGFNWAVKVNGVDPQFFKQPFGRRLDALRTIQNWKKDAKSTWVDAKGKATVSSVKQWVKDVNPSEFFAKWKPDSGMYKEDSVEIFYKR